MPLHDLVALRPSTHLPGAEYDHFTDLFAHHDKVKCLRMDKISRQDFVKGWLNVWKTESPRPYSKKLTMCITQHLRDDPKVDLGLLQEIQKVYRRQRHRETQNERRIKRRTSKDPVIQEERKKELELIALYNRRRMATTTYINHEADAFANLLDQHGIDSSMKAEDIEQMSRVFREELGGAQMTTYALRHFLRRRDRKESGIPTAIESRSRYNVMMAKKNYNDAKRKHNRDQNGGRVTRKPIEAKENATQADQLTINKIALLRASHWWTR